MLKIVMKENVAKTESFDTAKFEERLERTKETAMMGSRAGYPSVSGSAVCSYLESLIPNIREGPVTLDDLTAADKLIDELEFQAESLLQVVGMAKYLVSDLADDAAKSSLIDKTLSAEDSESGYDFYDREGNFVKNYR